MATRYKSRVMPFLLYFEDRNGTPYEVTDLWKRGEQIDVSRLPILKENAKIGLRFYVESNQDFDDNAYCKIQANLYSSNDEQKSINLKLMVSKYNQYWIYEGRGDEEFPWRMGIYLLEVYYRGEKYVGGIKVLPHHLDEFQVVKVHEYLNNQVQDIIYDFVYSKKAPTENFENYLPRYWYYDYARKIKGKYEEFIYLMTTINKNPSVRLETFYNPSLIQGKIDNKSVRWEISNKGLAKNMGTAQHYVLNKNKVVNFNSKENQWIKNILQIWEKDVLEVTSFIRKDELVLEKKLNKLEMELIRLFERRDNLEGLTDVGENTKRDIKSQIFMTKKDVNEVKNQLSLLREWIYNLNAMDNKLVYFSNRTFLNEVNRGQIKPFLKKSNYYKVDSIYKELKQIRQNEGKKNNLTPILKPTWLIYEYFCLFKVIEQVKKLGYMLIEGINEDLLNLYFEDRIPKGVKFILENEDRVIHIWYDHYHANSAKEALERGEFFFTPNQKKKPDIKVDVFNKNKSGLDFQGSIIFDAKFSKLKNIYNPNYNNKITEQLSGYYSFFYNGKDNRGGTCVDKVICLYAGEGRHQVETLYPPIWYLKFYTSVEEGEPTVVGEEELMNILKTLL